MDQFSDMARNIRFLNAEDETLKSSPTNTYLGEENGVLWRDMEITVERDRAIKDVEKTTPAKIQIDVPLEWREVLIPFEWKNLPLP